MVTRNIKKKTKRQRCRQLVRGRSKTKRVKRRTVTYHRGGNTFLSSLNTMHEDPSKFNPKLFSKLIYQTVVKSNEIKESVEDIKTEYKKFEELTDKSDHSIVSNYKFFISFLTTFINITEFRYADNMNKLYLDLQNYFAKHKSKKFDKLTDFIIYIDEFVYYHIYFYINLKLYISESDPLQYLKPINNTIYRNYKKFF